jgi:hypothetical protein
MKQLLLLAIVGTAILGATTAFAGSTPNIITLLVESLGASKDLQIETDVSAAAVNFSVCESFDGVTSGTLAEAGFASGISVCPAGIGGSNTVIFGITDCDITDTRDFIPNGEVLICKLTGHTGTGSTDFPVVVAVASQQIGGGTRTAPAQANQGTGVVTGYNCAQTACEFFLPVTQPANGVIDVQDVGDVKVIAKGPKIAAP